jgi:hypothetical protein
MKQPHPLQPNFSRIDKLRILAVSIFLAMLLITFGYLVGLLLRQEGVEFSLFTSMPRTTATLAPAESIADTFSIPTTNCGSEVLVIGTSSLPIQYLSPTVDGPLRVSSDTGGLAYWVEGTDRHPLFILGPAPENFALMSTLSVGSTVTVIGVDCNSSTYNLSAPVAGSVTTPLGSSIFDGLTLFIQTDLSGAGFLYQGTLTEQEVSVFSTPVPSDVQAEIGLLETTLSPDAASIRIGISIYNFGSSTIKLAANDVTLTPAGGVPLGMQKSEPRLPEKIDATETKTFYFTFPRPAAQTATLKIFTVEYDIEGY